MKSEIISPMPGIVVDVLVNKGDSVLAGQDAVIIESMKMENPLRAPADGTVADVLVAKNDNVAMNQVLVIIN
ncbi:hypothetical protein DSCA_36600 [Desulfosarcina alkanivorans]|jgi:biotin carboxyl carrier protein|uniref:Lipoyl-binding domain-containing protein n=1 Tax=Desulfosarcina alkanivorans TaxID=571177 RepID=A0A5K7YN89_9BACT|nr:acetyl-CoA carboxylase biotin carboxyl carrier protein subunit [Desulfosarcina alkanivorans]BBO69730.1 hypothetical protein DSCA_36600 [Desulfosarcina alkanivorans]